MATVDFLGDSIVNASVAAGTLALVDDATNNVTTGRHGFAPKLPNDATKFLNGVGAYAVPTSGTALAPVQTFGSSTSATPGTTVADLQAASGKKLVGMTVYAGQTNTANTSLTVTVTYADATTTTLATGNATAASIFGNQGGAIRTTADAASALTAFAAKDITRVQVTTLGTGTGTRVATIAALETAI